MKTFRTFAVENQTKNFFTNGKNKKRTTGRTYSGRNQRD